MSLSRDYLRTVVPSVFAEAHDGSGSSKYKFISSLDVIDELEKVNWFPVSAKQDNPSKQDPLFCKHMLRFQNSDYPSVDGTQIEVIWINSHNRSFNAIASLGAYEFVCSNGLFVPVLEMFKTKTRHIGIDVSTFGESIIQMVKNSSGIFENIKEYKAMQLDNIEKDSFAKKSAILNWGENFNMNHTDLLKARRVEDESNSLWKTFNVIQENLIKGGIQYEVEGSKGIRQASTRGIKEIRREAKINTNLWTLMAGLYQSKI